MKDYYIEHSSNVYYTHIPIERGDQQRAIERLHCRRDRITRKLKEIRQRLKKGGMTEEEAIFHEARLHYYEEKLDIVRTKLRLLKRKTTKPELFLPALYIS